MSTKRMSGAYAPDTVEKRGVLYQRCRFCGEVKPITDFAKNGVDKQGNSVYRQDCKTCYNIRRRENATKKRHTDFLGSMKRRGEVDVAYTFRDWKETVIFFGGECCYCGRTMKKGERLTRDHLVPIAVGGTTNAENIVCACSSCNSSKGKQEWHDWYMRQPFFSQERMNRIFKWRSIIRASGGDQND